MNMDFLLRQVIVYLLAIFIFYPRMMHLKNKSEINITAAEFLHKQCLFPAVAHCAYYSCLQFMRYIWVNKMGKELHDIGSSSRTLKIGSHDVLINEIRDFLKQKSLNYRDFNNNILELKKLRTKSDYENFQIDTTLSERSIRYSRDTLRILKLS